MAKITITERDLTTAGSTSSTDNIVYVPGYSSVGPTETPTLCYSITEFKEIFGTQPYVFKKDQRIGGAEVGDIYIRQGDFEKGYLYAADLLLAGMPVLFERLKSDLETATNDGKAYCDINVYTQSVVGDYTGNDDRRSSDFTITESNWETVGDVGDKVTLRTNIPFNLNELDQQEQGSLEITTPTPIEVTRGRAAKSAAPAFVLYKYTTANSSINSSGKALTSTGNESTLYVSVEITVDDVVDDKGNNATIAMTFKSPAFKTGLTNITVKYALAPLHIEGVLVNAGFNWTFKRNGFIKNQYSIKVVVGSYNQNDYNLYDGTEEVGCINAYLNESDSDIVAGVLTVKAKYPGYYGTNLSFYIEEDSADVYLNDGSKDSLYTIHINNAGSMSTYRFSLNINSPKFAEKVDFGFITVMSNTPLDYVKQSLVSFKGGTESVPLILNIGGQGGATLKDEITIDSIYKQLGGYISTVGSDSVEIESVYIKLQDTFNYNIKFITSGPYYNVSKKTELLFLKSGQATVAQRLLDCASERGDSTALIDLAPEYNQLEIFDTVNNNSNFPRKINSLGQDVRDYGIVTSPNYKAMVSYDKSILTMPASLGYLLAAASSFRFKPTWMPIAGGARGMVPGLVEPLFSVSSSTMNKWQAEAKIAINPIIYIRNNGYCIYGNRTMHYNTDGLVANSFANIRVGSNDIKKVLRDAANQLMFDVNDSILWVNFRGKVEPYLDRMVAGGGLRSYKLERKVTAKKGTVYGAIRVDPVEGVENFNLEFTLEDNLVTVK